MHILLIGIIICLLQQALHQTSKAMTKCLKIESKFEELIKNKMNNPHNYWNCLKGIDQKRWFTNEAQLQYEFKMRTLDDDQLAMLQTSKRSNFYISGICNYSILSNPKYQNMFLFAPIELRTKNSFCNLVSQVIHISEQNDEPIDQNFDDSKTEYNLE